MDLGNSLFAFGLNYTNPSCGGTPLYNGNISQTFWKTANTDNSLKSYTYQYDALNRIKSGIDNTGRYNLASISYDKNGNILNLDRTGHLDDAGTVFGDMDKLSYRYDTGNKLLAVTDAGNTEQGFKDGNTGTGNDDYAYDANGNMTLDKNKKITNITYNHLNLPTKISFTFTDDPDKLSEGSIDYVYDAAGIKLAKTVAQKGLVETYDDENTFYADNFIYKGTANAKELVFFNHAEGYIEPNNGSFAYIYQYKDHLGNIRLAYSDESKDGIITSDEIKEENNYYPFGLKHKGYNDMVKGREHKFKYNGKELESDLGLDLHSYGARMYDATSVRWIGIDALAEEYYNSSPYIYVLNSPILFIDPDGNVVDTWSYNVDTGKTEWVNDTGGTKTQTVFVTNNKSEILGTGTVSGSTAHVVQLANSVVIANYDPLAGVPIAAGYNKNTGFDYNPTDLRARRRLILNGQEDFVKGLENTGNSGELSSQHFYDNYIVKAGTNSSFAYGAEHYFFPEGGYRGVAKRVFDGARKFGNAKSVKSFRKASFTSSMSKVPKQSGIKNLIRTKVSSSLKQINKSINPVFGASKPARQINNSWNLFLHQNKGVYKGKGWQKAAARDYKKMMNKQRKQ